MIPEVDGVLSADELLATARSIAALQLPTGMIPWFPGGHCDPWNHVETAMALDVAGFHAEAEAAYLWMAATQRPDGSWHNYYLADGIEDAKYDTNVCAYIATGIWHHWLSTRDEAFTARLWPVVGRALDWVLDLQTPRGEVLWAVREDGTPWDYALLTGSSSIAHAVRCGTALGELLGDRRPEWELSAVALADVVRDEPAAFAPKHRWAMDWYYPVLSGIVTGEAGRARLDGRWDEFVLDGLGVRCVRDEPWVTAAETAECALAYAAAGDADTAAALLSWTRRHRRPDGAYVTGLVYPDAVTFPADECTAYTAAAVILAADALAGATAASGVFIGEPLPATVDE